mmetsp:Transcript_8379/g.21360  ORF Transcript_8379/g.21360 Transcript_8379/m.21360 type:complete len:262 (-) Transcript_8379:503-1288(-)
MRSRSLDEGDVWQRPRQHHGARLLGSPGMRRGAPRRLHPGVVHAAHVALPVVVSACSPREAVSFAPVRLLPGRSSFSMRTFMLTLWHKLTASASPVKPLDHLGLLPPVCRGGKVLHRYAMNCGDHVRGVQRALSLGSRPWSCRAWAAVVDRRSGSLRQMVLAPSSEKKALAPLVTRNVVLRPTCSSKPLVGAWLVRMTTSCASMSRPWARVRTLLELAMTAHRRKRVPIAGRSLRGSSVTLSVSGRPLVMRSPSALPRCRT